MHSHTHTHLCTVTHTHTLIHAHTRPLQIVLSYLLQCKTDNSPATSAKHNRAQHYTHSLYLSWIHVSASRCLTLSLSLSLPLSFSLSLPLTNQFHAVSPPISQTGRKSEINLRHFCCCCNYVFQIFLLLRHQRLIKS